MTRITCMPRATRAASLGASLAAAALFAAGSAQAAITIYTSQASFLAAVGSPVGVDTYNDLDNTQPLEIPIARTAGSFSYSASAGPLSNFFPAGGVAGDIWLATNNGTDTITLSAFSAGAAAVGGFFFRSGLDGFATSTAATINVRAVDSLGATVTRAQINPATTSFVGFVSNGTISSVQVFVGTPGTGTVDVWPTINDLTVAAAAIPEPESVVLMLAGLGLVGLLARRRMV